MSGWAALLSNQPQPQRGGRSGCSQRLHARLACLVPLSGAHAPLALSPSHPRLQAPASACRRLATAQPASARAHYVDATTQPPTAHACSVTATQSSPAIVPTPQLAPTQPAPRPCAAHAPRITAPTQPAPKPCAAHAPRITAPTQPAPTQPQSVTAATQPTPSVPAPAQPSATHSPSIAAAPRFSAKLAAA